MLVIFFFLFSLVISSLNFLHTTNPFSFQCFFFTPNSQAVTATTFNLPPHPYTFSKNPSFLIVIYFISHPNQTKISNISLWPLKHNGIFMMTILTSSYFFLFFPYSCCWVSLIDSYTCMLCGRVVCCLFCHEMNCFYIF